MFRTGKRPDGSPIAVMPFGALGQMSEIDVQALHLYLTQAPAMAGRQKPGEARAATVR